jgi:ATP-dependent RNA helicase DeaD
MATVPTVADLRSRRLELTRATLRESIIAGGLDTYRVVVESLAAEFDVMDVAAAAVKQADLKERGADEVDIPAVKPFVPPPGPRRLPPPKGRSKGAPDWQVSRLFIGAGRRDGVRPADIVGAITNEVGVNSRAIGAIQLADSHAIVEVPEALVTQIIAALKATKIQGKKVSVRRDRDTHAR